MSEKSISENGSTPRVQHCLRLNLQITWNFVVINNTLITELLIGCLNCREVYDEIKLNWLN